MTNRPATWTLILFVAVLASAATVAAQERAIEFPDVDGYRTFTVDLHTHSVFSDGMVWPVIRMQESERDGLTLMAVTEHLEYQPRRADIPHPDRNRSYIVASEYAAEAESEVIVVNGAEITRSMPPGHVNAVFITDANALLVEIGEVDYMTRLRPSTPEEQEASEREAQQAIEEANRQNAFVFWNHPNWPRQRPDGVARLTDMHRRLIDGDLLHGIEVANDDFYSAEALRIALDLDLAISGESRTSFEMAFEVLNAIVAPETHPTLRLDVEVAPASPIE